jgi:hypothetical protein
MRQYDPEISNFFLLGAKTGWSLWRNQLTKGQNVKGNSNPITGFNASNSIGSFFHIQLVFMKGQSVTFIVSSSIYGVLGPSGSENKILESDLSVTVWSKKDQLLNFVPDSIKPKVVRFLQSEACKKLPDDWSDNELKVYCNVRR